MTKVHALQQPPSAPYGTVLAKAAAGDPVGGRRCVTSRPSPPPSVPKPPPTRLQKSASWAKAASAIVKARTPGLSGVAKPPLHDVAKPPLPDEDEAVVASEDETDQTWGSWGQDTAVDSRSSRPWHANNDDWVGNNGDWEGWDSSWHADDADQQDKSTDKWSSQAWNQPPEQHSPARRSRSPPRHVDCRSDSPETIFQYLCDDYNVDRPAFLAPWLDAN